MNTTIDAAEAAAVAATVETSETADAVAAVVGSRYGGEWRDWWEPGRCGELDENGDGATALTFRRGRDPRKTAKSDFRPIGHLPLPNWGLYVGQSPRTHDQGPLNSRQRFYCLLSACFQIHLSQFAVGGGFGPYNPIEANGQILGYGPILNFEIFSGIEHGHKVAQVLPDGRAGTLSSLPHVESPAWI